VAVIRGLDPKDFTVEDLTVVRLGLQSYIADLQGRQDHKGNMLGTSSALESERGVFAYNSNSSHHCG